MIGRTVRALAGHGEAESVALARGSALAFAARMAAAAAVFALNVFVARRFGADATGLFYLSVAIISVIAVVARLGLDNAVLRLGAAHAGKGEWPAVRSIYRRSVLVVTLVAAGLAVVAYLATPWLATTVFAKPDLMPLLTIMAPAILPFALLILHACFLLGMKRSAAGLFAQTALVQSLLLVALVLPFVTTIEDLGVAYIGAATAGLLILALYLRHALPAGPASKIYNYRELADSSKQLFPAAIMDQIVQPWAAIVALGIWAGASDIGWFVAANRLAQLVAFAILPVSAVLSPRIAEFAAAGDEAAVLRMGRRANVLMAVVGIPAVVPLLLAPEWVMGVFGSEFAGSGPLLVILAVGQIINVLTGPVRAMLMMTGNERLYRRASVAGGLSVIVLCLALVPDYGAPGAAWATAAGLVVTKSLSAVMVYMKIGRDAAGA